MNTYRVTLEPLRNDGKGKTAIIVSSSESEAMATAKMLNRGYRATRAVFVCRGSIAD